MTIDLEEAICLYEALDDAAKARLLGRFCFDLTIDFRGFTWGQTVTQSNLEKLQGINELQHKVLSQMTAHQNGQLDRYPDRVIFSILVEMAENFGLTGALQRSLIQELRKMVRVN